MAISSSAFNLILILLGSAIIDNVFSPHHLLPIDDLYRRFILPFAKDPMFEPYISVLGFLFGSFLFTVTLWWNYSSVKKNKLSSNDGLQEKQQHGRRHDSSSSSSSSTTTTRMTEYQAWLAEMPSRHQNVTFVRGGIGPWLFWVVANIGLYLGLIYIFQQSVDYGGRFYRYDEHIEGSLFRIALEVFGSVFAYDMIFSLIHRSMHDTARMPRWWTALHLTHHDHYTQGTKASHVMQVFHHHIVDGSLQVMVNALMQQTIGFGWLLPFFGMAGATTTATYRHTMSKMLHNLYVTYLLCETHSGQDYSWMTHHWLFPEWFGGPMVHEKHHQNGHAPYHQFFTVLD